MPFCEVILGFMPRPFSQVAMTYYKRLQRDDFKELAETFRENRVVKKKQSGKSRKTQSRRKISTVPNPVLQQKNGCNGDQGKTNKVLYAKIAFL